jgi:molybdopterin/thiamine biosynthesis adenylyltransferase
VVGAGGLGSPVIAYLAAAGVGTLGVIDDDEVSLSNLQRQMIHTVASIGESKVESASRFAQALNPHVMLVPHHERLSAANAPQIFADYDLVLDGTDNLATRRITAATAAQLGLVLVSGAVSMFDGQVTVFAPGGPQFEALYPDDASDEDLPSCEATGILGPLTGVIGTLMAMEAIKLLTGIGTPLIGRVLTYDGKDARFTEFML